jgi:hypothetical protein
VESYQENKKHTFGALSFHGCMHMMDEYGSYGYGVTDTWHVFGDPSIQVRTDVPVNMTVIHDTEIPPLSERFELDVLDVEGALCAISKNSILLGYGYTNQAGYTIIEFFEPLATDGYVDLVVTGYNKVPYTYCLPVGGNNSAPDKPEKPEGPKIGEPGSPVNYSTSTIDPESSSIYYMWDWGDGTFSTWLGPFNSSDICIASHSWDERGIYSIKVKAKDIYGEESDWSDPVIIIMPKTFRILDFIEMHFPYLYLIFSTIFNV